MRARVLVRSDDRARASDRAGVPADTPNGAKVAGGRTNDASARHVEHERETAEASPFPATTGSVFVTRMS